MYAAQIARRIPPEPEQLQVLVGTLLGRGRLVADEDGIRFVLALDARHAWLAQWTYARLAPLVPPPVRWAERIVIRSEPHPLYEELAARLAMRSRLRSLVRPEALWLWAVYERIAACERGGAHQCRCAALRPPRPRALAPAS